MKRDGWSALWVLTTAVSVVASPGMPFVIGGSSLLSAQQGAAGSSSNSLSIWDGVFSEEQARQGQSVYGSLCLACHQENLQGDSVSGAPPLAGADFLATWSGKTVKDLVEKIAATMPVETPGSMSLPETLDTVAYILFVNRCPPGQEKLSRDPTVLSRVVVTKASAGAVP